MGFKRPLKEEPEEFIKRGNNELIVNAKPIKSFFTDKEKFFSKVNKPCS